MGEIEFDFYTAGQAMRQIEEATNRMSAEVLSGFEETMRGIREAWTGEAGGRFQELAGREMMKLEQTVQYLEYTGACMQEAILTAKHTEEKTKEIANLRTY